MTTQQDLLSDDQVGSEDEYEISLAEGIEDEALKESPGVKKFQITSYGADYTVDSLVKRMRAAAFIVPSFQRRFVWSQKHASRFIESLLMGLPIPSIFLYKEPETNRHLVIDGQQRLRSLQAFYDGLFEERKFRLQGVREPWNGKTYAELGSADQLKIDDSIVHATIFQQDSPVDRLESIYFVFERINSGGIRLSPQEIRNCIAAGPFIELTKKLNKDSNWRAIFSAPENKRAKDEELIVRFFAMLRRGDIYEKPMGKFLNDASSAFNSLTETELKSMEKIFRNVVKLTRESLDGRAFRPIRSLNAAVFDSVLPAIAERLEKSARLPKANQISAAYDRLLTNPVFMRACERATSDEETVKLRRQLAHEAFFSI